MMGLYKEDKKLFFKWLLLIIGVCLIYLFIMVKLGQAWFSVQ